MFAITDALIVLLRREVRLVQRAFGINPLPPGVWVSEDRLAA